jgi:hypothetical protein
MGDLLLIPPPFWTGCYAIRFNNPTYPLKCVLHKLRLHKKEQEIQMHWSRQCISSSTSVPLGDILLVPALVDCNDILTSC